MLNFLNEHVKTEKASFHMPGHKGAAFFARQSGTGVISRAADHDITEIPGADDLRHPDGIIKAITDKYAAIYGSGRAFISVNGSSALIMAAIMTCVKPGHKLIASADCHISVRNGAELAGAEIVYVEPRRIAPFVNSCDQSAKTLAAPGSLANKETEASPNCDGFCIPAGLSAESIAKALYENPDADAVILPSPNYFGIVSDIKAIADVVHKSGKVLIVDQAHGAHLKMFAAAASCGNGCGMMPAPAEECGADIVIVSTHKTLASFTQTAVANVFGSRDETDRGSSRSRAETGCGNSEDRVDPEAFERKLLMLESTSPSYVLMESLAVNAEIMERHGAELAGTWRADLDWFYSNVKKIPAIRVLTRDAVRCTSELKASEDADETLRHDNASAAEEPGAEMIADLDDSKIVVDFSGCGLSGEEAEKVLIEKGIVPEFSTGSIVMFLTGIGNVRRDYELLLDALAEIAGKK